MSKKDKISELTNILSKALRHRIGSIVNEHEIYAERYSKDSDTLIKSAQDISLGENWSIYDKAEIKTLLKKKLQKELEEKEFINEKKFKILDKELEKVLLFLELN
ncbi:hypothetical protein J4463_01135 [Candidatus Pacearchaeota archaeon]|nr:hypothetical protein [Candidatus Pacearchaeota archaeon]